MRHLARRLLPVLGVLLFSMGLLGDCLLGLLLFVRGAWQLCGWHLLFTLIWVLGVHLMTQGGKRGGARPAGSTNTWGMTAFLLGAGTFPGLGVSAYSMACLVGRYTFRARVRQDQESIVPEECLQLTVSTEHSAVHEHASLARDPEEDEIESERALIARISRVPSPSTTAFLRQLLSDPRAEIRSDASIALSRLDDEMSRALRTCFVAWQAQPDDPVQRLALARQYFEYASSNVLDERCQQMYLALARDLLLQASLPEERHQAQWWLLLARIRQLLGEYAKALEDVQRALRCQPDVAGAALLALELAFRVRAWDVFFALTSEEIYLRSLQAADFSAHALVQWWTQSRLVASGGGYHG